MMKKFAGVVVGSILANGIPYSAFAEDITAKQHIRVGSVVGSSDISTPRSASAMRLAASLIGKEAVRTIYQGQPILQEDVQSPTLVRRNAIVQMTFVKGGMTILTEGRALDDGSLGSRIRVINLSSKRVITTTVTSANTVVAAS